MPRRRAYSNDIKRKDKEVLRWIYHAIVSFIVGALVSIGLISIEPILIGFVIAIVYVLKAVHVMVVFSRNFYD